MLDKVFGADLTGDIIVTDDIFALQLIKLGQPTDQCYQSVKRRSVICDADLHQSGIYLKERQK